ncbi:MAG TPA: OsmC family protein [Rhizomicrobium sp.]|jgi:organic hydroperoxide reductase OsmC/OhrA
MTEHHAGLRWKRSSDTFTYDAYNRAHDVTFKQGAIVVPSSASPAYRGDAGCVDPEEAFVGALASCHMLSFLAIAARKRLTVDVYEDEAVGTLEKDSSKRLSITRVVLHPRVTFAPGTVVDEDTLRALHHRAHEECFIANSVKTDVTVEQQD